MLILKCAFVFFVPINKFRYSISDPDSVSYLRARAMYTNGGGQVAG